MSSSHGFQGGGGGGDQVSDEKVDSIQRLPNPNSHIRPHIAPAELFKADFKANIQTVKTVINRPIAPAPGNRITQHVTGVSATTQLLGSPTSHNILAKMPVIGLDGTHPAPTASIPTIAGHQTVTVAVTSVNSSTATGVTSIRGSLNIPTPVTLPTGSSLVHQHVSHAVQVPMASLIRSPLPPGGTPGLTQQTVTSIASHLHSPIQPIVQPFTSHVPRGAAAASALHQSVNQAGLAIPKTATMATAVLRPNTPVTMQIPFCTSVTTISTTAAGVLQSLHAGIGQRVVMAPVRSVTPPLNRSTSPTVTIPGGAVHHADIQHRPVLTPATTTTVGGSTVQISIHQPRVADVARVGDVTALHHQPRPIQASDLTRPLLSQLNVATAHKQHGAATALLQPSMMGQHAQPVTLSQVNLGQPTAAAVAQSGNLAQPVSVGLTTGVGQPHMQKIITTSITTSHPVTTTKIGASGQAFAHSAPNTRPPQKIVMSAAQGTMVDPVMKKIVMSGAPGMQVISKAATSTIGKQKMLMTPQQAALAGIHPAQTHTPSGVTPVLNLSQQLPRQQKMVVSQVTVPSTITAGPHMVTVPKPVTPVATTMPAMAAAISMATTTATTMPTVASIPVAKVTPQRQITVPASPQQTHIGAGDAGREPTIITGNAPRRDVPSAVTQQQQQPQAASMFIPQMHRGSPNPSIPPATTTAINLSATFTESRTQERITTLPPYQYQLNDMANYSPTIINYSNIMYQPQVAAQAFASISNAATNIRPGLVPNSNPQLTATLQAAAHAVTVNSSQGGVRINPLMVTVDPSRHPSLAVHTTQYAPPTTSAEAANEAMTAGVASVPGAGQPTQLTTSSVNQQAAPTNLTASPRPSILRKRPNDAVTVVKKNLLGALSEASAAVLQTDHLPPAMHPIPPAVSPKPSIHDPSRENSQSSTDTATSAESTPKSATTPEIKIKQEPMDTSEGGGPGIVGTPNACNSVEASPRKKPRKQLLNATEDLKDGMSSDEEVEKTMAKAEIKQEVDGISPIKREEMSEYVDDEGVRWVCERKRPNIALLNHYQVTWKPRNNHFLRYTDVKPKEERRPTVNELSNQRCVVQKASGWKIYHLASQLETMVELEREVRVRMAEIQDNIAPKHIAKHTIEDDIGMVHELTQGNIQRCKLVVDQLHEAHSSMMNVLDHKKRILDIIQKHHSKRPVKKKERS